MKAKLIVDQLTVRNMSVTIDDWSELHCRVLLSGMEDSGRSCQEYSDPDRWEKAALGHRGTPHPSRFVASICRMAPLSGPTCKSTGQILSQRTENDFNWLPADEMALDIARNQIAV